MGYNDVWFLSLPNTSIQKSDTVHSQRSNSFGCVLENQNNKLKDTKKCKVIILCAFVTISATFGHLIHC